MTRRSDMNTLRTGAIVYALLAIANSDSTFWQAIFTVSAALCLFLSTREERKAADR